MRKNYPIINNDYPSVLTIAGSDSSGGAGIQADIKTISATGGYAASVITVLTAQNTQGVNAIFEISAEFISQQLTAVFNDLNICAVKIGMLYNQAIIERVKLSLQKFNPKNIVIDPVMISQTGYQLLQDEAIDGLKNLFPLAALITPNLPEAEKILQQPINNIAEMESAAMQMSQAFQTNVLLKGGHGSGKKSSDLFFNYPKQTLHWLHAARIDTLNTHGTGCTLSAAIASFLAQDYPILDAITQAKKYLSRAIKAGSQLKIGQGAGPVRHFFNDFSDN